MIKYINKRFEKGDGTSVKARTAFVLLLCLLPVLGCTKAKQLPDLPAQTPIAIPTASAVPTPAPTRTPSANDLVPTITPEITFVPLPTAVHTPDFMGNTPTPTPAWATPYPAATGDPLVPVRSSVQMGTVVTDRTEGLPVYKHPNNMGRLLGTVYDGERYAVLDIQKDSSGILFNGEKGYLPTDVLETEHIFLAQTAVSEYTLGSLNVYGIRSNARLSLLADALRQADLDVVGLQEVIRKTKTDHGKDWLALLAEEAGYPYYAFCQTLRYDSGQYGTAILSKYPIVDAGSWKLDVAEGKEVRYLGYASVLLDTGVVHVFNTHLCASEMHLKSINLASLAHTLQATGVSTYTVTGDFNCSPPRLYHYMPHIRFANIDKTTFGDGSVPKILDNVLYTEGIVVSDVRLTDTISTGATDHMLLSARIHVLMPQQ